MTPTGGVHLSAAEQKKQKGEEAGGPVWAERKRERRRKEIGPWEKGGKKGKLGRREDGPAAQVEKKKKERRRKRKKKRIKVFFGV